MATKEPTSILKNEIFQRILSAASTRGTSPRLREMYPQYTHIHVLGQLLVAANQSKDLDQYTPAKNEVKLAVCLYDTSTGEFQGIAMRLAYIIIWRKHYLAMAILKRNHQSCTLQLRKRFPMPSSPPHSKSISTRL